MVTQLVEQSLSVTPITQVTRPTINEATVILGTGDGGNVATALPPNTPTLFRYAPPRTAAATGAAIAAGVADGDWSAVFNVAQTRGILNTLDFNGRNQWAHVNEEAILIHVAHTGSAPPTNAQWEAAIDSMAQIATRYPNHAPSIVIVPDYDFLRDAASPYDATTPTGSVGAIPWLPRLISQAEDIGAIVVLCGSPTFTRAEAQLWAARNRGPAGSKVVAVWPGAQGSDHTAANALSSAPNLAWSVLEVEERGRGGVSGRGTPLNLMPAEGLIGIVPAISQSYDREDTDDFLLEQAGITVPFNHGGEWRWKRVLFNRDYSTTAPDPRTDSVSVQRYLQRLQVEARNIALQAFEAGLRGEDFFNGVIQRLNGVLAAHREEKLVQSGRAFRQNPAINPATTANIGYQVAPYYDFDAVNLRGEIDLPEFNSA